MTAPMTVRGVVRYRDLEGGVWVLEAEDGRVFQLDGGDRKLKKDGATVEAEGDIDGSSVSAAMVGPLFRVSRYRFVD